MGNVFAIDPGKKGGWASEYGHGKFDTSIENLKEKGLPFYLNKKDIVYVESFVNVLQKGMKDRLKSLGFLQSLVISCGAEYREVQPRIWQKDYAKYDRKKKNNNKFLLPHIRNFESLSDGESDAILILQFVLKYD